MSLARQLAFAVLLALGAQSEGAGARELFQDGVALAKEERWSEALAKFERSRALIERPSTVFNIATTLVRLNRHKEAIQTFERFIELTDQQEQRKAAEELIARSRESLASLELTIEPTDALLIVDGEAFPPNGPSRHLELDPGERILEVSAEGFGPIRETIALEPGAKLVRKIALEPIPSPPPPEVAVAPPPPPPAPLTPIVETEPQTETGSIFESPWFWVIAGAVVVATAAGIGIAVGTKRVEDPVGGNAMDVIVP